MAIPGSQTTILYAEDDQSVREALERALKFEGYDVHAVTDGAQALEALMSTEPDVIVLDVMMPVIDGLTTCRRIREKGIRTPVLMLTARVDVADRVAGLDAGADDYLVKPFDLEELLARLRALVRRGTVVESEAEVLEVEDMVLDLARREVRRGDLAIDLTKTEFELLALLMHNSGIVLTREVIYERIWGYDFETNSKSLDVYIGYLRRKTEVDGLPRLIHTVRGVRVHRSSGMSLRWRLTAVIGGVVALMLFTASFLAYVSAEGELNQQVDEFLLTRSRETEAGLDTGLPQDRPLDLSAEAFGFQRGTLDALTRADASIQLLLDEGDRAVVISQPTLPITEDDVEIASMSQNDSIVRRTVDREVEGKTYRILVSSNSRGALMVGRSVEDVTQTLNGLRGWLLMISTVGSLAAALVGWLVADRVLRPVARLAAATEQVAETQRFDADLQVDGSDELGALARSFNSMLSTLRASRVQQERLVRDANHELRTPLTSLRTNIDVLRRRGVELEDSERDAIMHEMDGEVRELTDLVSELVGFATNSSTLAPDAFVEVDLARICAEAADRTARRTGRGITVSGLSQAVVMGDPAGLERAVGNLVGNAVKFSPPDASVEIAVLADGVEVRDRGPGIEDADLDRIFDRFYRADATRSLPGSGLGLAIVSEIARAHGGDGYAANRPDGGAVVGLRIEPDLPSLSA